MIAYQCKVCKKHFVSIDLVKSHLQWFHNIPPRKIIEDMHKLKNQLKEYEKILDDEFCN